MGMLSELREAVSLWQELKGIPDGLPGGGGAGGGSTTVVFNTDVKVAGDVGRSGGGGSTGARRVGGPDLLQTILSEVRRIGGNGGPRQTIAIRDGRIG